MSVILFIVILGTLVLVHELGHFVAAKRAGVRVDEFGIGFPPRLYSKKIGETRYSINLFPLGGFVKIFGEDEEINEGGDSNRSLIRKPKYIQAWIIIAGIVFNLLFAWLVLSLGFMVGMPYSVDDSPYAARVTDTALTISQVLPASPAEMAGFKAGDKIIALAAGKEEKQNPSVEVTQDFIATHDNLKVLVARGAETKEMAVSTVTGIVGARRAIGVSLDMIGTLRLPPHEALYLGAQTAASFTRETALGMFSFFKNIAVGKSDFSEISGPVGIVGVVRDAEALGFSHLVTLVALISINLAVINILPFPALDGGRLFFLAVETVKRSPIRPTLAATINAIGFALLIALMVFVTYHDVVKLLRA